MTTPTKPGWYWAKWKMADDGTAEGDENTPSDKWEVVEVYEPNNNDGLMRVFVPGVARTQSLENFFWGPGPLPEPAP